MFISKQDSYIFFNPEELAYLVKIYATHVITDGFTQKEGEKLENLNNNKVNIKKIKNTLFKKEIVEFLVSIIVSKFYNNSEIGFQIKNNLKIDEIASKIVKSKDLKILVKAIEENTDCDFAINNSNNIRKFQLKQCKEKLNTENLFNYIRQKIDVYKNLGQTNLIILAQGNHLPEQSNEIVDINEICKKIQQLNYDFQGEVLILKNSNGVDFYIFEVYPKYKRYKKKIYYKDLMKIDEDIVMETLINKKL